MQQVTDVESRDQYNYYTLLIKASFYGQLEIARLLLEYGAGVNEQNKDGNTPLRVAAERGHSEVVKLLLETNKVDINRPDNRDRTALMFAARKGHLEVVKLLLETNKTDINKRDEGGETALGDAVGFGHLKIVKLLLANGADANLPWKDLPYHTLLMGAKERVKYYSTEDPNSEKKQIHTEIIYLLLDFGADLADLRVGLRDGKTLLKQVGSEVIEKYIHSRKLMQEETLKTLMKKKEPQLPEALAAEVTEFTYRNLSEFTEMLTGL